MAGRRRPYNCCKERGSPGQREEIVLRTNHTSLVEKFCASSDAIQLKLIDLLFEVGILDSDEYRDVLSTRAVRLIMAAVLDSGPDSFFKFMDALRMAGYNELATDLEQQLETTVAPPPGTPNRSGGEVLEAGRPDTSNRNRREVLTQFVSGNSISTVANQTGGNAISTVANQTGGNVISTVANQTGGNAISTVANQTGGNAISTVANQTNGDDNSGGVNNILGQVAVAATNSLISAGLQRYGLGGLAASKPVIGYTFRYRRAQIGDEVASTWDIGTDINVTPDVLMGVLMKF